MTCHSSKRDFQSPDARVQGLGSAHTGVHHWWMQRLSAIALTPLSLWVVYSLVDLSQGGYDAAQQWVSVPSHAIALILFLVAAGYHSYLGMQVIFDDYIRCAALRLFKKIAFFFCICIAVTMGIFAILSQAL
mgnify:CR=1 FL=1